MATAASTANASQTTGATSGRRPPQGFSVRQWLILGACFGVGYGITDRLVNLQFTPNWSTEQRFEVRPFPGTELQTLRRQSGDSASPIRADLDRIEAERQQKREAAELETRRATLEGRGNTDTPAADTPTPPTLPEAGGNDVPPEPPEAQAQPPVTAPTAEPPAVPAVRPPAPPGPTP